MMKADKDPLNELSSSSFEDKSIRLINGKDLKIAVLNHYNVELKDVVIHEEYRSFSMDYFKLIMANNPILMGLKAIYEQPKNDITYWKL